MDGMCAPLPVQSLFPLAALRLSSCSNHHLEQLGTVHQRLNGVSDLITGLRSLLASGTCGAPCKEQLRCRLN